MYVDHFKLKNRPFVDGAGSGTFLSTSESDSAVRRIQHVLLARDGAAVITGGPGVGKSAIIDEAVRGIQNRVRIAHIDLRHTEPELLYQMVLFSLGDEGGDRNIADSLHRLRTRIRKENKEGRKVTVVIDINGFTAERANHVLRLALLGGETHGQMNLILLGPHSLHKLLDIPGLIHIRQRIAFRYRVRPFSVAETNDYIEKQFNAVKGKTDRILPRGVSGVVYQYVGGVPRLINTLMDAALSEASSRDSGSVSAELIHEVAKDLGWKPLSRGAPSEVPARPQPQDHAEPAGDAVEIMPRGQEKPPVLGAAAVADRDETESAQADHSEADHTAQDDPGEDHPDNVRTGLIFEQPLEMQAEPEEELNERDSVNNRSASLGNGKDDELGGRTNSLLAAAEEEEKEDNEATDVLPENDDVSSMPKMTAEDTGATGMLKLEDLDARFAETVFGEDTGMVNALQELARMRGLDNDEEPEPESKAAENK